MYVYVLDEKNEVNSCEHVIDSVSRHVVKTDVT